LELPSEGNIWEVGLSIVGYIWAVGLSAVGYIWELCVWWDNSAKIYKNLNHERLPQMGPEDVE